MTLHDMSQGCSLKAMLSRYAFSLHLKVARGDKLDQILIGSEFHTVDV